MAETKLGLEQVSGLNNGETLGTHLTNIDNKMGFFGGQVENESSLSELTPVQDMHVFVKSENKWVRYSGSSWVDIVGSGGGSGATNLDGLTDVTITNPSNGQALVYNGSIWVNSTISGGGGGASAIDDLTDVTITSSSNGQFLKYNGSVWVNSGISISNVSGLQTALDGKASSTHTHAILDVNNLQETLDGKALSSHTHTKSEITDFPTLGTAAAKNVGTSAGNVPELDSDGKLNTSILPAIAITNIFEVATEAAMLALNVEVGDVAVRSDISKSFILSSSPASTLANWVELKSPSGGVSSVNTKTGAVVISASDIAITDTSNNFTTDTVQGAIDQLFTFANNGKTQIAAAIGSPATASDTFLSLSTAIIDGKATLERTINAALTLTESQGVVSGSTINTVNSLDWSPDGKYLAVAHNSINSTHLSIYRRDGINLTKLDGIPQSNGSALSVSWSPDGKYLAVGLNSSPWFLVYTFNSEVLSNGSVTINTLPNVAVNSISWRDDGDNNYSIAIGLNQTLNQVSFYNVNRNTNDVTLRTGISLSSLPGNSANGIRYSPNGSYLVVTLSSSTTNSVRFYRVNSATSFTLLTTPSTTSIGSTSSRSLSWSPDNSYVTFGHNNGTGQYVAVFSRNGDVFTRESSFFDVSPTGTVYGLAWHPSGNHIYIGHSTSPFVSIYKKSGSSFQKIPNITLSPSISGSINRPAVSPDGSYVAIGTSNTPFLYHLLFSATFAEINNSIVVPSSTATTTKAIKVDETVSKGDVLESYYRDLMVNSSLVADGNFSAGTYNYVNAWSPDGVFWVVGTNVAPFILIYKRSGNTLTQLVTQSTAGGVIQDISWSPDSVQFTITIDISPYVYTYRRQVGDTFEKLTKTASLTSFSKWSPTNEFVATATSASPFFRFHKRATTGFTTTSPISALPSAPGRFVWSPDGTYFALTYGSAGSFVLRVYQRSTGDTFTQLGSDVSLSNFSLIKDIQWSSDNYIAIVGSSQSPTYTQNFAMYQFSSGTLTSVSLSGITIPNSNQCSWHPSGAYLAIANTSNSPYVTILKKSGNTFTNITSTYSVFSPALTDASMFTGATPIVNYISWTKDGNYLTFTSDNHSNIAFYRFADKTISPQLFTKISSHTNEISSFDKVIAIARESGVSGSTIQATVIVGSNNV